MADVMYLYLDDSGARNPDRNPGDTAPKDNRDFFALGGAMVRDKDRSTVEAAHRSFCEAWGITDPLHAVEIRNRNKRFRWLYKLRSAKRRNFKRDLLGLMTSAPLIGTACVIDRPGYNLRFKDLYREQRWSMCKTAFNVVVERAAKFARNEGCKLVVYIERCNRKTDAELESYYHSLRADGPPFNGQTSSKYRPLTKEALRETLYDFQSKTKQSRMMQLADLYLWPICVGGYDEFDPDYQALRQAGKLLDARLPPQELELEGIKYSCWELVNAQKQKSSGREHRTELAAAVAKPREEDNLAG